jgi:hypothetical protein
MASPTKFSMQGALDVAIRNLETGDIEAYLEDCTTTGVEVNTEKVYSMGAGGAYVTGFSHSKRIPVKIVHGYPTTEILAIQAGQDTIVGTNKNVVKFEKLKVTSNTFTTSKTALGTAGAEIGSIWTLDSAGGLVKKLVQAGTASPTAFSYTVGTKVGTTSGVDDDTMVLVAYNYTADATAKTIKFDKDVFAGNKEVIMTGIAVDNCTDKHYKAQFIFRKMAIMDGFSFSFEDTGSPVVENLDMEALSPCSSSTLMEFVLFDEDLTV